MRNPVKKLYYRIGEVCDIVGVEPHVLRYWESEFSRLSPPKNKAGQRTYRPKDIDLLLAIRALLYDEGFTIAGARKRLGEVSSGETAGSNERSRRQAARAPTAARPEQGISQVRRELENILTLLDRE